MGIAILQWEKLIFDFVISKHGEFLCRLPGIDSFQIFGSMQTDQTDGAGISGSYPFPLKRFRYDDVIVERHFGGGCFHYTTDGYVLATEGQFPADGVFLAEHTCGQFLTKDDSCGSDAVGHANECFTRHQL